MSLTRSAIEPLIWCPDETVQIPSLQVERVLPVLRTQEMITFPRAAPAALAAFDPRTKRCTMNCGPSLDDPRSPEERRFLCPDCETVPLPRQQDFEWADKQLPAGVTRQDVCIWTQDSDGPWNTSCGVTWEFNEGGPSENGAHFCHHCGGVLMAQPFADDDAQPNAEVTGA